MVRRLSSFVYNLAAQVMREPRLGLPPMSLQLRLILALLAVVAISGIGGLISLQAHRGIDRRMAELSPSASGSSQASKYIGRALEAEGSWHQDGVFVATHIETLPKARRPKLRGKVQAIDRRNKTLTVYGRSIEVTAKTVFVDAENAGADRKDSFDDLAVGLHIEVSCSVNPDKSWMARKIKTKGVKQTLKVKGTVTAASDHGASGLLEIHGLPVRLDAETAVSNPASPLKRMENARRMTLAAEQCLISAHELLKEGYRQQDVARRGNAAKAEAVAARIEAVGDELRDGQEDYLHYLKQSTATVEETIRTATGEGAEARIAAEKEKIETWLEPLEAMRSTLEKNIESFMELAGKDADAAQVALKETLEPHLRDEILPLVRAFHVRTEDDLATELRAAAAAADAATRMVLLVTGAGLLLALGLGLVLSRSISKPIRALKEAARQIGKGKLDTRVDIRSRDELGVLADTFNQMARELAESTVSVSNLNRVLADKELLLREVHHRVKNNLQVISSLLDLQSQKISDPDALERFRESQDLIRSMSLIHEQLTGTSNLKWIDFATYLELLTSHLSKSYSARLNPIRLRVEAEKLSLGLDQALSCGLIVNELVTNAFKYAFPDDASGEIVISSRMAVDNVSVLEVSDNGRGVAADDDTENSGLGMSLVRALVRQLHGKLVVDNSDGTSFRVEFPVTAPEEVA